MINELSADYIKAKELDRRIKTSAQLAQQSLYDMCMSFKEMRDSKLYKELGYSDFGDYCEKETQINRQNVYKYIGIVEKLPEEFVSTSRQIGISKLYLLSTLSEEDRTEITETTDLENTSVRELKEKIKELEKEKDDLQAECILSDTRRKAEKEQLEKRIDRLTKANKITQNDIEQLSKKKAELEQQIKELESRPIDVAVVDHGDENRLLKETIKSLERENIKQNEALSEQYQRDVREVRENLENEKRQALEQAEKDKQKKLEELRSELVKTKAEYEKKLAEKPSAEIFKDDKEIFKAYLSNALDSAKRLCDFVSNNKDSINFNLFYDKSKQLAEIINARLGEFLNE